ncbi:MAG: hypothetical protein ACRCXZ_07430, partial [Patescibacteria group bacterium]
LVLYGVLTQQVITTINQKLKVSQLPKNEKFLRYFLQAGYETGNTSNTMVHVWKTYGVNFEPCFLKFMMDQLVEFSTTDTVFHCMNQAIREALTNTFHHVVDVEDFEGLYQNQITSLLNIHAGYQSTAFETDGFFSDNEPLYGPDEKC